MLRKEANKKILEYIGKLIDKYPVQRFGQIIANYVFPSYMDKDIFFEESESALVKLEYLDKEVKIRELDNLLDIAHKSGTNYTFGGNLTYTPENLTSIAGKTGKVIDYDSYVGVYTVFIPDLNKPVQIEDCLFK